MSDLCEYCGQPKNDGCCQEQCPACKSGFACYMEKCPHCQKSVGLPNVRRASRQEEMEALEKRYEEAKKNAGEKGLLDNLNLLEQAVTGKGRVAINLSLDILCKLILEGSFYENYHDGRKVGRKARDDRRVKVEKLLFGECGERIYYGALSVGATGLIAYGDNYQCNIFLKTDKLKMTASLLEENSYFFFENKKDGYSYSSVVGFFAPWEQRRKLVVSKLFERNLMTASPMIDFQPSLLKATIKKENDEFVEVFLFGRFNADNIEFVSGTSKATRVIDSPEDKKLQAEIDQLDLEKVKQRLGEDKWLEIQPQI